VAKKTLESMVLPELRQLASSMGIKTTGLKKADLMAAIGAARAEEKTDKASPGGEATALDAVEAGAGAPDGARQPDEAVAQPEFPGQDVAVQPALVPVDGGTNPSEPADTPGEDKAEGAPEGARTSRRSRRRLRQQTGIDLAGLPPVDPATSQEVGARLAAMGMEVADQPASSVRDTPDQLGDDDDDFGGGRRRRNRRNRERQNRRRPTPTMERIESDPQVREGDVLWPVSGIVDVMEGYAFVRTTGYLPGPEDAYMSLSLVRRYGLRKGDLVTGAIRQPRENERREKFNPLIRLDTVNGDDPAQAKDRPEFTKLTPLYPQERLRLETGGTGMTGRIMDLVSPIGKGQRGLIVSPPKAGKTLTMQAIANAITANNPEVHLMVVLVDERPEEVTDFQRTVSGEVIASTFDRPAEDHTTIAELALERAKRLVEMGNDVVILLDGITRLSRAYNLAAPASGRILSGGVDSAALYPPKKFFGAARNIENGGSLTILATALIETGSKMDEVIFEEFKGTGNMELRLRRDLADKRIFPAIDVDASGTRREELLLGREEMAIIWKLRRVLSGMEDQAALEMLLKQMRKTNSNHEFLVQISRSTP